MQAKEPVVDYVAKPPMLTISVLKNGVMDILQNFAKMNLIRINQEETEAEIYAAYKNITPETMLLSEKSLAKDWNTSEEDEAWKTL